MEDKILQVMSEIDDYGGVEKAIEEGYIQMRIAERARERKEMVDSGERIVVGVNKYRRDDDGQGFGELFELDPAARDRIIEKYHAVMDTRDNNEARRLLGRLGEAAQTDQENLMPYIVDCCHAYVTVGEMVGELKRCWGEFQEPVRLT
jgi:methylmalonyl-CoA mutase N-terminal domain/subunit